jgi:hypothetical protein
LYPSFKTVIEKINYFSIRARPSRVDFLRADGWIGTEKKQGGSSQLTAPRLWYLEVLEHLGLLNSNNISARTGMISCQAQWYIRTACNFKKQLFGHGLFLSVGDSTARQTRD